MGFHMAPVDKNAMGYLSRTADIIRCDPAAGKRKTLF
jgi:hypothetical protein